MKHSALRRRIDRLTSQVKPVGRMMSSAEARAHLQSKLQAFIQARDAGTLVHKVIAPFPPGSPRALLLEKLNRRAQHRQERTA